MVHGLDCTKIKKKPWKTQMERDIILNKDLCEVYAQKGKTFGNISKKLLKKRKHT